MANDILKSLLGRRFGLGPLGELLLNRLGLGTKIVPVLWYNQAAAGTAVTNTTAETVAAAATIPANSLQPGSLIKIKFQGIATSTNSTDTLTVKLYIGGVSGT